MKTNEIIRQLRLDSGMTQGELAEKIGYKSKASIHLFENGERKLTFDTAIALARLFDVPLEYLAGDCTR